MAKKEVDFYKYCNTCKFDDKDENEDPCFDCLKYPSNDNSKKPVKYKEKKSGEQKNIS